MERADNWGKAMGYETTGVRGSVRLVTTLVLFAVLLVGASTSSAGEELSLEPDEAPTWAVELLQTLRAGSAGDADPFEPNDSAAMATVLGSDEAITVAATFPNRPSKLSTRSPPGWDSTATTMAIPRTPAPQDSLPRG